GLPGMIGGVMGFVLSETTSPERQRRGSVRWYRRPAGLSAPRPAGRRYHPAIPRWRSGLVLGRILPFSSPPVNPSLPARGRRTRVFATFARFPNPAHLRRLT